MFSIQKDQYINNRYRVEGHLRSDAFGEWYRVVDIKDKNSKKSVLLFSIPETSPQLPLFVKFYEQNVRLYEEKQKFEGLILFDKISSWKEKERVFLIFVFSQMEIIESLGARFNWDETKFKFNTSPEIEHTLILMEHLIESVVKIHEQNIVHSYISPDTLFFIDNKLVMLTNYFYLLLTQNYDANITSITENSPDLQVFPLAPELIKDRNNLNSKSDVWSLGILFKVLLTNKLPFHFTTESEYISAVKTGKLKFSLEGLDQRFKKVITDALMLDPVDRSTSSEFLSAFKLAIDTSGKVTNHETNENADWLEFISEENEIELPYPGSTSSFRFLIHPTKMRDLNSVSDRGKNVTFTFISREVAVNSGKKELNLNILPRPILEIDNERSFLQKEDTQTFNGRVAFRVAKSSVQITKIELEVIIEGDSSKITVEEISFPQFNNKLHPMPIGHYEFVEFKLKGELNLNTPYKVQIIFHLKNHKPITYPVYLVPNFPAKLETNLKLLLSGLQTFTNDMNEIAVPFKNSGGASLRVREIYTRQSTEGISFNNSNLFHSSRQLNPGEEFEVKLSLNATNYSNVKALSDEIVIKYDEISNRLAPTNQQCFKFNWRIVSPHRTNKIAIDFGTSNSCVCIQEPNGDLRMLDWSSDELADDGTDLSCIPSYIYYSGKANSGYSIGKIAKDAYNTHDANSFHSIKRFIGQNLSELILEGDNFQPKTYEQMTIDFLRKLKHYILKHYAYEFDSYVFTHPTGIDKSRKEKFEEIINSIALTYDSGNIKFIDEATAGALNYIRDLPLGSHYFLIYDFGGGTTDVVFTKYSVDEEVDVFGGKIIRRSLSPVFNLGKDFGGDDINYSLINALRETYDAKDSFIPYIHPDEKLTLPPQFSGGLPNELQSNSSILWIWAENFKKSIEDSPPPLKRIYMAKGTSKKNPASWSIEKTPLAELDLNPDLISKVKEKVFVEVGEKLDKLIYTILTQVNEILADRTPFTVILVGRSSQFQITQSIFSHYLSAQPFPSDKFKGFNPSREKLVFHPECRVELQHELKHIIAKGALEIAGKAQNILIKNTFLQYSIKTVDRVLIRAGTEKIINVDSEKFILANNLISNYAVFITEKYLPLKTISIELFRNSFGKEQSCGTLSIRIPIGLENKNGRLCLFVDNNDSIRWFYSGINNEIFLQGEVG
jgi:hypothetical protein